MSEILDVQVKDKNVDVLSFEDNEYVFSYSSEDKKDFISLTMPIRTKSWYSTILHLIFEIHLLEGYLLSIYKKAFFKIS